MQYYEVTFIHYNVLNFDGISWRYFWNEKAKNEKTPNLDS